MSDELNDELQDSNLVEETIQEPEIELTNSESEDPETLKAKIAELEEKNKQLYARVKKTDKPVKEQSKENLTTNKSSSEPPVTRAEIERLELKTEGYTTDEVDFLMQNGGRQALKNEIAMAGIEAMRKKRKSVEATPSGTGKSAVYQKYTAQDLRKMSAEDLEKIIPQ